MITFENFSKSSNVGRKMYSMIEELYPICRSITGNGVRETLKIIQKEIPIEINEVPSGTQVFDWIIPKEWNINDAYIKDPNGEKIVDFQESNLHVVSYSIPVDKTLTLDELKPHLHSIPEMPDTIPYLTSYYKEDWGFCLPHKKLLKLKAGEYEVLIDSNLKTGSLTYGELYLPGKIDEEIILSCYICHPSVCNDNLSGISLTAFLAKHLSRISTKYSYRFLFIPETIGAITWLFLNEKNLQKIKHGLVVTCVGDSGNLTYKKSRIGNEEIDRAALNVLRFSGKKYSVVEFFPQGSDERQFCSPGFNLPVGSLMRTIYGKFPEYHTSADDLNFVKPECLADTFSQYVSILHVLENNEIYQNLNPKCEPQLGKRGMYRMLGAQKGNVETELTISWVLNLSDGSYSLLDISDKSGFPFKMIKNAADLLVQQGLLKKIDID